MLHHVNSFICIYWRREHILNPPQLRQSYINYEIHMTALLKEQFYIDYMTNPTTFQGRRPSHDMAVAVSLEVETTQLEWGKRTSCR